MRKFMIVCLFLALSVSVFSDNGPGKRIPATGNNAVEIKGDQIKLQTQDRLQDGSCKDVTLSSDAVKDKIMLQTKEQPKDGSCKDVTLSSDAIKDMLRLRTQDQLKDGSCKDQ